jgi:alanine dehydrogenase
MTGPLFISSELAAELFRWDEAIAALQNAYRQASTPAANLPRLVSADQGAWFRVLPSMPPGCRHFGAKLMGVATSASRPAVEYVIVLFDRETSRIAAFVDGAQVTAYRTAATSAAAIDRMAGPGPFRLAVLGSGLEASMHTRALAAIRPLSDITVFSPTPARRQQFAGTLQQDLAVPTRAVDSPQAAAANADIVLAAARSHGEKPILFGEWLRPGALVVSIGSTVPQQREIDISVIARAALIVCDRLEEVMSETGDMIAAAQAGLDVGPVCRSLSSLLAGEVSVPAGICLYKSVGSGLQDVVVADLLVTKAARAGLGIELPVQFQSKAI